MDDRSTTRRRVNGIRTLSALVAIALGATGAGGAYAAAPPDYVIHNAKIVTVDGRFSIARAAAVTNGRFSAVGEDAEVLKLAGPGTRRIDMRGRTVLPGFNDTHIHVSGRGKTYDVLVDLTKVKSIEDIRKALAERAKTTPKGEWIVGSRGWWEYDLKEQRTPTRYELDAASSEHPIAIPGPHYIIANSLALKLAGVTRDTKDPQGGEVWKDPKSGEPTGLLMDNAGRFVSKFYPGPTRRQQIDGVRKIIAQLNAAGMTSAGDPSGSPEDVELFRALHDAGQLNLRIDFSYNIDPAQPLEKTEAELKALPPPGSGFGDGMFRSDQLGEVGLDGAELSAFLRNDFPGKPGYRGLQKVPYEQFDRFAALANRYGWRLRPHAVGDAAIDQALRAFAYADKEKSLAGRRWMIDHAFLLLPDHYPEVKRLGVLINSQYMHNYQLGALILIAWKRPLADMSLRYKDWVANGVMFANGSDGPVSYHSVPLLQIYGSVTRKTGWGGTLGPEQGLSREDAIRSMTQNGAYTSFEEKVKGSIEPGKYADFVVLSGDILTVPADTIKDLRVLATVLGGRTVHGDLAKL